MPPAQMLQNGEWLMKKRKKPIAVSLIMSMVIMLIFPTCTPVSFARRKTVKLKKITLNYSTYKLQKGKSLKLKASFKPKKTTQKKIKWKSGKKSIAKVSKKGVVKAVKVGKTTITAKVKGTKKKATCKIQVVLPKDNGSEDYGGNGGNGGNLSGGNLSQPGGTAPTETPNPSVHKTSVPKETAPSVPDTSPAPKRTGNPVVTSPPAAIPDHTDSPTKEPTKVPTKAPTDSPTKAPTKEPTKAPTKEPTKVPTKAPTKEPIKEPTKAPTKEPTKAPTKEPTKEPAKAPATSIPTPKYERPDATASPVKRLELTAEGAIHNEAGSNAKIVNNPDGSVTVTFLSQYAAVNFYLPDNAQNYYSNYKSVVLTYTSEGGNLGHALYDVNMAGPEDQNAGKHPDWSKKIVESKTEKTLVFSVTDDCAGGCIRGFQIFCPDKIDAGKSITITIQSIIFSDKESPTAEDLNPASTPVPTPTPTEKPTLPPLITREPGAYGINGPVNQGNDIVWDSVAFGSYYQSLYEPAEAIASPEDGQEYADSDGTIMIYKGGSYYKKEPIIWRVLSVNEDDAFIVSEQSLDTLPYNDENSGSVTWQESSIRQWLNEEFYSCAFTDQDKSTILSQGSDAAADQVYLLSADEVKEMDYGFAIHHENKSATRQVKNTAYAQKNGAWTNSEGEYAGNGWWWLRDSGSLPFDAAYVGSEGFTDCSGFIAVNTGGGVRPALHINLTSAAWTAADKITVSSAEDLLPTPEPTENPQKKVTLSAVRVDSSFGSYDIDSDTVRINDTRTGEGETFLYFPNPITVKKGETIRVTISGPKWGSNDFRIWTTPSYDTGNGGAYTEDPHVYLKPTIRSDGSYSGTVEITAKDGECNCLSIKAGYGVKIQDLIISEIIVERVTVP